MQQISLDQEKNRTKNKRQTYHPSFMTRLEWGLSQTRLVTFLAWHRSNVTQQSFKTLSRSRIEVKTSCQSTNYIWLYLVNIKLSWYQYWHCVEFWIIPAQFENEPLFIPLRLIWYSLHFVKFVLSRTKFCYKVVNKEITSCLTFIVVLYNVLAMSISQLKNVFCVNVHFVTCKIRGLDIKPTRSQGCVQCSVFFHWMISTTLPSFHEVYIILGLCSAEHLAVAIRRLQIHIHVH